MAVESDKIELLPLKTTPRRATARSWDKFGPPKEKSVDLLAFQL